MRETWEFSVSSESLPAFHIVENQKGGRERVTFGCVGCVSSFEENESLSTCRLNRPLSAMCSGEKQRVENAFSAAPEVALQQCAEHLIHCGGLWFFGELQTQTTDMKPSEQDVILTFKKGHVLKTMTSLPAYMTSLPAPLVLGGG